MATVCKHETDDEVSKFFLKLVRIRELGEFVKTVNQNITYKRRRIIPKFIGGMEVVLYDAELFGIKAQEVTFDILTNLGYSKAKKIHIHVNTVTMQEYVNTDNDPDVGHLYYDYIKETKYTLPRCERIQPVLTEGDE